MLELIIAAICMVGLAACGTLQELEIRRLRRELARHEAAHGDSMLMGCSPRYPSGPGPVADTGASS